MSKMTWITEVEEWEDISSGSRYPAKTVTIEIDSEESKWGDLLTEFFHYCNASGYIIDATAIPDMVEACEEIHTAKWYDRNKQFKRKEVDDATV